ncbi:DASS family sodium-coupled anion symporter [Campylobacter sp. Cr9]|uniref:DASS family sodium-coupled anion symporter n=1 Tax=Campylobacter sp. Cr9 TaxID=2735728 RepID=UPI00301445FE|nr:DASS family sodium-coupled anion symporter [Campylobacter sp. Cr9]
MSKDKIPLAILCILIALSFVFIPVPESLVSIKQAALLKAHPDFSSEKIFSLSLSDARLAWIYLGCFIATILCIILKVMPLGAVSLIAIAFVAISTISVGADISGAARSKAAIKDALSAFSNSLIWLIVISIMLARGIIKTGLGRRLAFYFLSIFGKKTLGIGYSIALSEVFLAPITPSNTARGGGIINPIVQSIAKALGSEPNSPTQNKAGTYLSLVNYQSNPITSAMFITATAPNPLVVKLISDATNTNISITWGQWALGMFVPGMCAILLMPLVIYFLSPPELKQTPDARELAKKELAAMGKFSLDEKIMLSIFGLCLFLWAGMPSNFANWFGFSEYSKALSFDPASVAALGLAIALLTGVLKYDELLAEKTAWDTLVWFAALIMLATMLDKLGLAAFLGQELKLVASSLGLSTTFIMIFFTLAFLYSHYFFASTTAHISAMFLVFYKTGLDLGAPPMLYAFMLAAAGNIMMALTHYATGTAPVVFGSGYVSLNRWWIVGFIVSVVDIVVMICVGLVWWKILGFY